MSFKSLQHQKLLFLALFSNLLANEWVLQKWRSLIQPGYEHSIRHDWVVMASHIVYSNAIKKKCKQKKTTAMDAHSKDFQEGQITIPRWKGLNL